MEKYLKLIEGLPSTFRRKEFKDKNKLTAGFDIQYKLKRLQELKYIVRISRGVYEKQPNYDTKTVSLPKNSNSTFSNLKVIQIEELEFKNSIIQIGNFEISGSFSLKFKQNDT
jgi:hypothetical protein